MKKLLAILALFPALAYGQLTTVETSSAAWPTIPNDPTTGTTQYTLTKMTGANAIIAGCTDTYGIIGVTLIGAGTTGNATVAKQGTIPILFDGTPTAGDFVQASASTCGYAHDIGNNPLATTTQCVGRVYSGVQVSGSPTGVYNVLWGSCTKSGGGGGGTPGGATGSIQWNNGGMFGGATVSGIVASDGTNPPFAANTNYLSAPLYALDIGIVNALVGNPTPAATSLTPGLILNIAVAHTNTGATTISVSGSGNVPVVKRTAAGLSPLVAGDIVIGQNLPMLYDGTNWEIDAFAPGGGGGGVTFPTGVLYGNNSASAPTAATSAQIVAALNTSPSTTFAPALLPLATTSAFGAVKPDGTTITISGGVITSSGTGIPYPGAGIPKSTGSAWLTSYTPVGTGTEVPLASTISAVAATPVCADGTGGIGTSGCGTTTFTSSPTLLWATDCAKANAPSWCYSTGPVSITSGSPNITIKPTASGFACTTTASSAIVSCNQVIPLGSWFANTTGSDINVPVTVLYSTGTAPPYTYTLSANVTGGATNTYSYGPSLGNGWFVTGTGIPANSYVTGCASNNAPCGPAITINANATATNANLTANMGAQDIGGWVNAAINQLNVLNYYGGGIAYPFTVGEVDIDPQLAPAANPPIVPTNPAGNSPQGGVFIQTTSINKPNNVIIDGHGATISPLGPKYSIAVSDNQVVGTGLNGARTGGIRNLKIISGASLGITGTGNFGTNIYSTCVIGFAGTAGSASGQYVYPFNSVTYSTASPSCSQSKSTSNFTAGSNVITGVGSITGFYLNRPITSVASVGGAITTTIPINTNIIGWSGSAGNYNVYMSQAATATVSQPWYVDPDNNIGIMIGGAQNGDNMPYNPTYFASREAWFENMDINGFGAAVVTGQSFNESFSHVNVGYNFFGIDDANVPSPGSCRITGSPAMCGPSTFAGELGRWDSSIFSTNVFAIGNWHGFEWTFDKVSMDYPQPTSNNTTDGNNVLLCNGLPYGNENCGAAMIGTNMNTSFSNGHLEQYYGPFVINTGGGHNSVLISGGVDYLEGANALVNISTTAGSTTATILPTGTYALTTTSGSTTATSAASASIPTGSWISGTGISASTLVTARSGSTGAWTYTLSVAPTANGTSVSYGQSVYNNWYVLQTGTSQTIIPTNTSVVGCAAANFACGPTLTLSQQAAGTSGSVQVNIGAADVLFYMYDTTSGSPNSITYVDSYLESSHLIYKYAAPYTTSGVTGAQCGVNQGSIVEKIDIAIQTNNRSTSSDQFVLNPTTSCATEAARVTVGNRTYAGSQGILPTQTAQDINGTYTNYPANTLSRSYSEIDTANSAQPTALTATWTDIIAPNSTTAADPGSTDTISCPSGLIDSGSCSMVYNLRGPTPVFKVSFNGSGVGAAIFQTGIAATISTNSLAPPIESTSRYWNGATGASATDSFEFQAQPGTGTDPVITDAIFAPLVNSTQNITLTNNTSNFSATTTSTLRVGGVLQGTVTGFSSPGTILTVTCSGGTCSGTINSTFTGTTGTYALNYQSPHIFDFVLWPATFDSSITAAGVVTASQFVATQALWLIPGNEAFSATSVTFYPQYLVNRLTLSASTAFTIAAGAYPGENLELTFFQNSTGGFTVSPPTNVKGFFTPSTAANTYSTQHFTWHNDIGFWLASDMGITNQVY